MISVTIPHFNDPVALARCLDALAAQQDPGQPWEINVVDNGSVEMPVAICAGRPNVSLLLEREPGPGPARNTGAAAAKGDILAFTDSDCIPSPHWLATIAARFAADPELKVIGGNIVVANADPQHPTMVEAYENIYSFRNDRYIREEGYSASANMAMRRAIFPVVGGFAGRGVAEDRDWGQRATGKGIHAVYVPDMLIHHPARPNFAALLQKWDRHIAHDFQLMARGPAGKLRWGLRAIAIALSSAVEAPKILTSDRLPGMGARLKGLACLTRVRLYRMRRMLALLLRPSLRQDFGWNSAGKG